MWCRTYRKGYVNRSSQCQGVLCRSNAIYILRGILISKVSSVICSEYSKLIVCVVIMLFMICSQGDDANVEACRPGKGWDVTIVRDFTEQKYNIRLVNRIIHTITNMINSQKSLTLCETKRFKYKHKTYIENSRSINLLTIKSRDKLCQ
jgi:hypothetical protein